jgi:putative sigma-54 modulation protein
MQIRLTARHCEIGPDLRTFAEKRLGRIEKFGEEVLDVHVIVSLERKLHTVEITLRVNHHDIVITESHAEVGAALELAAERLEERLRREKQKRVHNGRHGGPAEPAAEAEEE